MFYVVELQTTGVSQLSGSVPYAGFTGAFFRHPLLGSLTLMGTDIRGLSLEQDIKNLSIHKAFCKMNGEVILV